MLRYKPILVLVLMLCSVGIHAQDGEPAIDYKAINPFSGIIANAGGCFEGYRSLYFIGGAAATAALIYSGADYRTHNYFAQNAWFDNYSNAGVAIGSLAPIALSGGLLAYGIAGGAPREYAAGCAALQASGLALGYVTIMKFFTGRPHPERGVQPNSDLSATFRFGFDRGGVYAGWPSGHLITNTAAVTSIMYFYKNNAIIDIAGGIYLGYLFLGVLSHHGATMHWLSDEVAGTLMGFAIGSTVGSDFRARYDRSAATGVGGLSALRIEPGLGQLSLSFNF